MGTILVTRDTKGKCRVIEIELIKNDDGTYTITRSSGLIGGKQIQQPEIHITHGKVKRNTQQQSELEYNALVKKAKDKGYKELSELGINDLSEVDSVLSTEKTDQNGALKPQLCKVFDETNQNLLKKTWLGSFKLDGLRVILYYKDGEIVSSSRGGGDYNVATTYIRQDEYLNKIFKENPDLILDGELYRHGWSLAKISGLGRKETLEEEHKELNFYCYDIISDKSFKFRCSFLGKLRDDCNIPSKLVIVEHVPVTGIEEINTLHDKAISLGYEGVVVRDPEKEYKCGARDQRMLKIKRFTEDCFKVIDIQQGLRPIDDMVFVLETKEGKQFNAKPIGDREIKKEYTENFESKYKNQIGEVKYFYYSDDGIPLLPVFRSFRFDLKE